MPRGGLAAQDDAKTIKMTFRVSCTLDYGETLWLTGNHAALGGWIPIRGVQMRTKNSTYPMWIAECRLPVNMAHPLRYKYVVRSADGQKLKWEDKIPDRVLAKDYIAQCFMRGAVEQVQ